MLASQSPIPYSRDQRLNQADFLLHDYGFDQDELVFDKNCNLPPHIDPNIAWAECHLRWHPIKINQAHRNELLRISGMGPANARRLQTVGEPAILKKMLVNISRACVFNLLDGRQAVSCICFKKSICPSVGHNYPSYNFN